MIGGPMLVSRSPSIDLPALVYTPPVPTECKSGGEMGESRECDLALLTAVGVTNLTDPVTRWNITQVTNYGSAAVQWKYL